MRMGFCGVVGAFAVLMGATGPVVAQTEATALETCTGEEGFESPPAKLDDALWLLGKWVSRDDEGGATEYWREPIGPIMIGTFIAVSRDENGAETLELAEQMHLREVEGSLIFEIWTTESGRDAFYSANRLIATKPCALYFESMTMRCSDPAMPGEGLIVVFRSSFPGEPVEERKIIYQKASED